MGLNLQPAEYGLVMKVWPFEEGDEGGNGSRGGSGRNLARIDLKEPRRGDSG
jgi:hypothetical protein